MDDGGRLSITAPVQTALGPGAPPFTFGRHSGCDLVLGDGDRSISRVAGRFRWTGADWMLDNTSSSRPLHVVSDVGLRTPVAVGTSCSLGPSTVAVQVVGGVYVHEIRLVVGTRGTDARRVGVGGLDVDSTLMPTLTANERVAMVAMLEGYLLDHPRYTAEPRTYAEAAARIGLPVATVRKRIENVRRKFVLAGLSQLERSDARAALAEFALSTELVSRADLPLLDARSTGAGADRSGTR